MNDHNTNVRTLWDSVAAWTGLGVAVTIADALLEACGRKPKPNQPKEKNNNNQEKEKDQ